MTFEKNMLCSNYYMRGVMHCHCNNVIYLITCKTFLEHYAGSAINY